MTILDKHRQIGNAVPPPMGRAIGTEIRKAMAKREQKRAAVIVGSSGSGLVLLKEEARVERDRR